MLPTPPDHNHLSFLLYTHIKGIHTHTHTHTHTCTHRSHTHTHVCMYVLIIFMYIYIYTHTDIINIKNIAKLCVIMRSMVTIIV